MHREASNFIALCMCVFFVCAHVCMHACVCMHYVCACMGIAEGPAGRHLPDQQFVICTEELLLAGAIVCYTIKQATVVAKQLSCVSNKTKLHVAQHLLKLANHVTFLSYI